MNAEGILSDVGGDLPRKKTLQTRFVLHSLEYANVFLLDQDFWLFKA